MNFNNYNYRERKSKVEEILDNTNEVKKVVKFPSDDNFTYTNGYKSFAGAIFVDLRDSTSLFNGEDDLKISKVIRGFTSEIIEILRLNTDNKMKEIGIRGDCVFAVYSTPIKNDIHNIVIRAGYINTYLKMLNKLLTDRNLPNIKAGIGLAAHETLAVKAGRKSSGVNNFVWIGDSVAKAAKLSDLGNKDSTGPIVMSEVFYDNFIDVHKEKDPDVEDWFTKSYDVKLGYYYHSHIINVEFDQWIDNGMND